MQVIHLLRITFLGVVLALTAACASKGANTDMTDAGTSDMGVATMSDAERARLEAERMRTDEARRLEERQRMLLTKTVFYFDFDQSAIHPEDMEALAAHAQCVSRRGERVVLEGHTDERGTREYNLALGERRAESVERYLSVQGVANRLIEKVSFGEERPAELGNNESAWSKNRRVEIKYQNGGCLT